MELKLKNNLINELSGRTIAVLNGKSMNFRIVRGQLLSCPGVVRGHVTDDAKMAQIQTGPVSHF